MGRAREPAREPEIAGSARLAIFASQKILLGSARLRLASCSEPSRARAELRATSYFSSPMSIYGLYLCCGPLHMEVLRSLLFIFIVSFFFLCPFSSCVPHSNILATNSCSKIAEGARGITYRLCVAEGSDRVRFLLELLVIYAKVRFWHIRF